MMLRLLLIVQLVTEHKQNDDGCIMGTERGKLLHGVRDKEAVASGQAAPEIGNNWVASKERDVMCVCGAAPDGPVRRQRDRVSPKLIPNYGESVCLIINYILFHG